MTDRDHLPRVLGVTDMVMLGVSSVIGSGIFLLPGTAAAQMGPAAVLPLIAAGVLCVLIALCFAEVGSRFESTGGSYLFAREAYGEFAGFSVGWMSWWVRMIAWAALCRGFALALHPLLGDVPPYFDVVTSTAVLIVLAAVNFRGARAGAVVMNVFTVAKMVPLAIFVGVGVFFLDGENLAPFAPHGYGSFADTTVLLLWAYVGFELIAVPSGEMRNPSRTVPLAFLIVMGVVTAVYLLVFVVASGTYAELPGAVAPVADAAGVFLGPAGGLLVTVGIAVSIFGTSSVSALVTPRIIYALAERKQAPAAFTELHANYRTPALGILVSSAITLGLILSGSFEELAVLSVVARFFEYISTCTAAVVFRRRDRLAGRDATGMRLPLGPTIPVLATVLSVGLLSQTDADALKAGGAAFLLGVPFYLVFGRGRAG